MIKFDKNQVMDNIDFRNNPAEKLTLYLEENGFSAEKIKKFKQSFRNNIADQKNIKSFKNKDNIIENLPFQPLKIFKTIKDHSGNEKFIFLTNDNLKIESIYMPNNTNNSICVSTQIGCRMKCIFCKTGLSGFKRNLMTHEILEQVRIIYQSRIFPEKIICVAFMGMGEPFDNLLNSYNAFLWLGSDWGYQIAREKITFSTILNNNIDDFFDLEKLPNLAISLHSADEITRRKLIPNSHINFEEIRKFIIRYTERTKKQVTIEYCLINGVNDTVHDAEKLAKFLYNYKCKVNVLNYNKIEDFSFSPSSENTINEFINVLKKNNIPAIFRKSLGTDINAGCGQLG
jgi:23S rRNA (adenine2503-C2)-methyltransferase